MRLAAILFTAWCAVTCARADDKLTGKEGKPTKVALRSGIRTPKVPLAESPRGVVVFRLTATVDGKGEGKGTLTLDPNTRTFDEFGQSKGSTEIAEVKLECTLKFVKSRRSRGPGAVREYFLYRITGPKITSPLFLSSLSPELHDGWLLIHNKNKKVEYVLVRPYDARRVQDPAQMATLSTRKGSFMADPAAAS